jgi:dephospho-CoA kinase
MGKSTAATYLGRLGWQIIDTDVLAREVVAPGQPAWNEIIAVFGKEMVGVDGALDRKRLAEVVFANATQRQRLEEIVHPRIRERWLSGLEQARGQNALGAVVVIPLLFETNAQSAFDKILCTACKDQTQLTRLRARGWSDQQIQQRLAAQWSSSRKMLSSDFVIWTEGDKELQYDQLRRVMVSLEAAHPEV